MQWIKMLFLTIRDGRTKKEMIFGDNKGIKNGSTWLMSK